MGNVALNHRKLGPSAFGAVLSTVPDEVLRKAVRPNADGSFTVEFEIPGTRQTVGARVEVGPDQISAVPSRREIEVLTEIAFARALADVYSDTTTSRDLVLEGENGQSYSLSVAANSRFEPYNPWA